MDISSIFSSQVGGCGLKSQTNSKSSEFVAPRETKNEAYELDISEAAQNAYQANSLGRAKGSDVIAAAISQDLQDGIKDMQDSMNRILLSRNIDTSKEIKVSYENGKLVVDAAHPDKEKIEKALNSNPEFLKKVQDTTNKATAHAGEVVKQKFNIALENKEKDDEDDKLENEYERELRLKSQLKSVNAQIQEVSGDFSLSNGQISFASLNLAAGTSF